MVGEERNQLLSGLIRWYDDNGYDNCGRIPAGN